MNENETTYTQGTGKRISELAKQYGIQTPKNSDMLVIAQQNQESETGAVSRATRFDTLAETVRAPHEQRLISLERSTGDLQQETGSLKTRVSDTEQAIDQHNTRIGSLETRIANDENRITALESRADPSARITALENWKTNTATPAISNHQTRITDLENRMTIVEGAVGLQTSNVYIWIAPAAAWFESEGFTKKTDGDGRTYYVKSGVLNRQGGTDHYPGNDSNQELQYEAYGTAGQWKFPVFTANSAQRLFRRFRANSMIQFIVICEPGVYELPYVETAITHPDCLASTGCSIVFRGMSNQTYPDGSRTQYYITEGACMTPESFVPSCMCDVEFRLTCQEQIRAYSAYNKLYDICCRTYFYGISFTRAYSRAKPAGVDTWYEPQVDLYVSHTVSFNACAFDGYRIVAREGGDLRFETTALRTPPYTAADFSPSQSLKYNTACVFWNSEAPEGLTRPEFQRITLRNGNSLASYANIVIFQIPNKTAAVIAMSNGTSDWFLAPTRPTLFQIWNMYNARYLFYTGNGTVNKLTYSNSAIATGATLDTAAKMFRFDFRSSSGVAKPLNLETSRKWLDNSFPAAYDPATGNSSTLRNIVSSTNVFYNGTAVPD